MEITVLGEKNENVEVIVLLDRSGSMAVVKSDMEAGLNQLVEDQKRNNVCFTLMQFDTDYEVIYDHVDIGDIDKVRLEPRGCTALLDALGKSINDTYSYLCSNSKRKSKVLFVVITDGLENASKEFKRSQIFDMIKEHEKDGWKFVYLGANQDSFAEGGGMGFNKDFTSNYEQTEYGIRSMYSSLSNSVSDFSNSGEFKLNKDILGEE